MGQKKKSDVKGKNRPDGSRAYNAPTKASVLAKRLKRHGENLC